ncbi:MAG: hypothetical protein GY799_15755 [Desulfobulbaceae bacterium]|nr:hypothetical protein [Desulfobulbaceae bacterium]
MRQHGGILKEYVDADEDKRLSMFLAYRELRESFTSVEMDEIKDEPSIEKAKSAGWGLSGFCRGWWKQCRSLCC